MRKMWSVHPRGYYTREYNGRVYGIGNHPAIINDVVWDLVWLIGDKDVFTAYENGDAIETLSISCREMPYIIGSCWQQVNAKESLIDFAAKYSDPHKFLKDVKQQLYFGQLFLSIFLGPDWAQKTRAEEFKRKKARVIQGVF